MELGRKLGQHSFPKTVSQYDAIRNNITTISSAASKWMDANLGTDQRHAFQYRHDGLTPGESSYTYPRASEEMTKTHFTLRDLLVIFSCRMVRTILDSSVLQKPFHSSLSPFQDAIDTPIFSLNQMSILVLFTGLL